MKNKKTIIGTILLLFVMSGICNISHAWTDDFTLPALSYRSYYLGYLNDGDIIKINEIDSTDIITVYIMNDEQYDELTWESLKRWQDITYLARYDFDITVDDRYYIVFRNKGILFSRTVHVDMLVEYAKITITSPTYYDTFVSGNNYITWTSAGSFDYVKIELYKSGIFLETITIATTNDGSYSWYIYNNEYTDDSNYQIKITDYYEPTTYDYSSYFTIESETKSITITLPTLYTTIQSGYNDITWTSTGSIDYVKIELYKDGIFLETIDSYEYNDGTYSWYIYDNDYTDGLEYQIKISNYYDNSIYDYSSYFTIECEVEKTITITNPTSIDTFEHGQHYITWISTGDIDYVKIELYKDGYFLETIDSYEYNDGSYAWYIYDDDYIDNSYYQIKISDYYDNSIYDYSDYFSIELNPYDNIWNTINNILVIVIPIVAIILVITIPIWLIKKHKRRTPKEPIIQTKEIPKITYCPECGVKITDIISGYCSKCGSKIIS